MPMDLFQQAGINPGSTGQTAQAQPKDLFQAMGHTAPNMIQASGNSISQNASKGLDQSSTGLTGGLYSAASGHIQGDISGLESLGTLAHNVLNAGAHVLYGKLMNNPGAEQNVKGGLDIASNALYKGAEKVKNFFAPSSDFEKQAVKEHPTAHDLGSAVGYIGTQAAGGNQLFRTMSPITSPLTKALPMIGESPALQGAAEQGIQNAVVGAANDKESPLRGAVVGGLVGTAAGAIGGSIGYKVQRASKIIQNEMENAVSTGVNPYSHTSIANIQSQLRNEGIHLRTLEIKNQAKQTFNDVMEKIRPNGYDPEGDRPINYIAKAAGTNFTKEVENSKQLYAPINENKDTFTPSNLQSALTQNKTGVLDKVNVPELPKTDDSKLTTNQMLAYRKQFDSTIRQAKNLARNGKITDEQANSLYPIRQALNQDIHTAAEQAGLKPQLDAAESHYNQNIRPFQVYNKNTNELKLMSEDQVSDKVWKTALKQLQARFPNPSTLKNIASTLGPEGQSMLGWAKIENDLQQSMKNGVFQPSTFAQRVSKGENTGLNQLIMTKDHQDVVSGINKTMVRVNQMVPKTEKPGMLTDAVNSVLSKALYNRVGLGMLKAIGSKNTTAEAARTMIQTLINGALTIGTGQTVQNKGQ